MPKREIPTGGLFLSIPGQREVAETLFKQRIPVFESQEMQVWIG